METNIELKTFKIQQFDIQKNVQLAKKIPDFKPQ